MKKVLYIDMDGVIADFANGFLKIGDGTYLGGDDNEDYRIRAKKVGKIVSENPGFFANLDLIEGADIYIPRLAEMYDMYFLSTPMDELPESFSDKRIWLDKHFGEIAHKRLILTHRKDLNLGHFLVDDRFHNGVNLFSGTHLHFGSEQFPNWDKTFMYLYSHA